MLCRRYRAAADEERLPPLLIVGAFIFDLLCIYPFCEEGRSAQTNRPGPRRPMGDCPMTGPCLDRALSFAEHKGSGLTQACLQIYL
jgi:hypothetical protein